MGAEEVGIPGVDRRDAGGDQGVETSPGVIVFLDDHRDIARRDLAPLEGGVAGQQRPDVAGKIAGDEVPQFTDRNGLGAGLTELLPPHHPQPEWVVARRVHQAAAAVVGVDIAHDDARVTQLRAAKHRLQPVQ